jgi:glutathione S-transferase
MIKLLGSALSPYVVRVMLAARFKGIELKVEAPAGGMRSREHMALTPTGKVPVLLDDTLVLPESDVIVSYLEDRWPTPTLLPGDAKQRAHARLIVRLLDVYSAPSLRPFLQNDPAAIAVASERIDCALGYIDHFRQEAEFAAGPAFSVADCALIPFFHAFERLQEPFKTFDLVHERPRLEAWWSRARLSPLGEFARAAIDAAVADMLRSAGR